MKNHLQKAATEYAIKGFKVIPLKKGAKIPLEVGWPEAATANATEVKALWKKYPHANIGILTGKANNLVVVDIDVKGEVNGFDSLGELISEELMSSSTPKVKTPSGGMHFYFRYTESLPKNKVGILDGVDIRSDGGYIVAPPSVTEEGEYKCI